MLRIVCKLADVLACTRQQGASRKGPTMNEKFEEILDLEFEVKGALATVTCQTAGVPPYVMSGYRRALKKAKADLYAAIDALTEDEMRAYGEYRLEHLPKSN